MTEQKKYTLELTKDQLVELNYLIDIMLTYPDWVKEIYTDEESETAIPALQEIRALTEPLVDNNDLLPF